MRCPWNRCLPQHVDAFVLEDEARESVDIEGLDDELDGEVGDKLKLTLFFRLAGFFVGAVVGFVVGAVADLVGGVVGAFARADEESVPWANLGVLGGVPAGCLSALLVGAGDRFMTTTIGSTKLKQGQLGVNLEGRSSAEMREVARMIVCGMEALGGGGDQSRSSTWWTTITMIKGMTEIPSSCCRHLEFPTLNVSRFQREVGTLS